MRVHEGVHHRGCSFFVDSFFIIGERNGNMVKVNGQDREHVPDTSIAAMLEMMNFSIDRVAVECNGEIIPRRQLSEKIVRDNDVLEIVSFVGGG